MKSKVTYYHPLLLFLLKEVCTLKRWTYYNPENPHSSEVDHLKPLKDNLTWEAGKVLVALPLDDSLVSLIRRRREGGTIASIITRDGPSLSVVVTSPALAYSRNFQMTIDNYLKYPLAEPRAYRWWGYISDPPQYVRPCYTEVTAGHKKGYTATGTSGIVSWRVEELSTTIIILWSVPYGSAGCNHLGIGVYPNLSANEPNSNSKYFWFHNLYFGPEDYATDYFHTTNWADYCNSSYEISQSAGGVRVTGVMSMNSAAKIEIRVEPQSKDDLVTDGQCASFRIRDHF